MVKYKKWKEIRIYSFLVANVPTNKPIEVWSDGWFLFGIPMYTRENI